MKPTILCTLVYPLPATTFTAQECLKIMRPILNAGLPRSGIVRSFPRAVVHGPIGVQGLGIPDLYVCQGAAHMEVASRFGTASPHHLTGSLLRTSAKQLKLELGCPGPVLSQNFDDFGHLATPCLLTCLWRFLFLHHMRMADATPDFPLLRECDQYLIPAFLSSGYRGPQLGQLNRCRLFLQAITLADITTGCGTLHHGGGMARHSGRHPPTSIRLASPRSTHGLRLARLAICPTTGPESQITTRVAPTPWLLAYKQISLALVLFPLRGTVVLRCHGCITVSTSPPWSPQPVSHHDLRTSSPVAGSTT